MFGRLSAARMVANLALVPLSLMAVILTLAAPASAPASAAVSAGRGAAPVHRVVLRTTVPGVSVRRAPDLHAQITSHLGARGTRVTVDCWARGSLVAGNPFWYHLAGPRHGYVTSHFINSRRDPYPGLVKCVTTGFRRTYLTRVAGLRVRRGPGLRFRMVGRLGRAGSKVVVTCWQRSVPIKGDPIWYHLISPLHGFVAGVYLNTGRDPARGVPHC